MEVHEGCPVLAGFAVVTGVVVVGDGGLFWQFEAEGLGFFEEHEAELELFLLQEDHGDEVAQFAEPNRSPLIFLTMNSICIFINVKQFLVDVKGFLVLGLFLQEFAPVLQFLKKA